MFDIVIIDLIIYNLNIRYLWHRKTVHKPVVNVLTSVWFGVYFGISFSPSRFFG